MAPTAGPTAACLAACSPGSGRRAWLQRLRADGITPAEARVLLHLQQGLSNRGIAAALVLSVRTVESHISSLLSKSNCRNRTQLLLWALGLNGRSPGDKLRSGYTLPA